MTVQQQNLYNTIVKHIKEHRYCPSIATLAVLTGKDRRQVDQQLNSLMAQGYITRPARGVIVPVVPNPTDTGN